MTTNGQSPFVTSHPHGCVSWNLRAMQIIVLFSKSHPHGCVSWNARRQHEINMGRSHTLTGVWVEICCYHSPPRYRRHTLTGVWVEIYPVKVLVEYINVTPSRVCELKCVWRQTDDKMQEVTPSRVCELKYCNTAWFRLMYCVTPSRVCELKC